MFLLHYTIGEFYIRAASGSFRARGLRSAGFHHSGKVAGAPYTPTVILISVAIQKSINKPPTRSEWSSGSYLVGLYRLFLATLRAVDVRVTVKPSTCVRFTHVRHMCVAHSLPPSPPHPWSFSLYISLFFSLRLSSSLSVSLRQRVDMCALRRT